MRARRNGFTLIELLVVIVIIAVLAAILFPIFARAKEQGKLSSCSSNMKQIYGALLLYTDAWNGFMPMSLPINSYEARTNINGPVDPQQIHALLAEYARTDKVFRCPCDAIMPRMVPGGPGGQMQFDERDPRINLCTFPKLGSSYQWRLGFDNDASTLNPDVRDPSGKTRTTQPLSGKMLSTIPQPSRLGAMRDAQPWHFYKVTHARQEQEDPHAGGNVLYCDGHVKFIHGGEFLAGIY